MNNTPNAFIYSIGVIIGIFIGVFMMYISKVKPNLLLPEDSYTCIDAEPTGTDPSIVACTIILRKGSSAYKKHLELGNDAGI